MSNQVLVGLKGSFVVCSLLLVFALNSCDDSEPSITKGKAIFALSSNNIIPTNTNGRISEIPTPAFLLLSIEDNEGKRTEVDKKMALHAFGKQYMTEDLELSTGDYHLTKFLVLDTTHKVIYASPLESADLAQYVSDPLPVHFSVKENTSTQIATQVLTVGASDTPEGFGYVSFDFDVVEVPSAADVIDLPVKLLYAQNGTSTYDSVYIKFSNSSMEMVKKQRLTVDSISFSASGIVKDLPVGNWNISIDYFKTLAVNEKSEVQTGSATVTVAASTTNLLSNGRTAFIIDSNDQPVEKIITWDSYLVFYFFDNNILNATVTLPSDPLNPFFEISLLKPGWDYFYADRTFYFSRPNEPDSHFLQGSAAFEKYNDTHTAIDYIDTTSFKSLTDLVKNKTWNVADALVIFYIDGEEKPIFYYQWFNEDSSSGRRTSVDFTREQINARKKKNLK